MTRSWTQNPSGIYVETFTPSPPSPLAELDAPFGNFATIDAILGRLNGTIVVQHASGSPTVYTPSANTDAARGTAFLAALAAAASGDVIYLAALVYDCQTTQCNIPAGITLRGAGIFATSVKCQYITSPVEVGATLTVGNGTTVYDLTLDITSGDNGYRLMTAPGNNCSATFFRVQMLGNLDVIFHRFSTGIVWTLYDCILSSTYDCTNAGAGNTNILNTYNTSFSSVSTNGSGECRCSILPGSHYGSTFYINTANPNAYCVSGATGYYYGCKLLQGPASLGTSNDVGGLVNLYNCSGSGSRQSIIYAANAWNLADQSLVGLKMPLPEAPSGAVSINGSLDGGGLADGTYYYAITAVDQNGNQTTFGTQSAAVVVTGAGGNGQVALTWAAVPGATAYCVYRSTTSGKFLVGDYVDPSFPATATNSYTDVYTDPQVGTGGVVPLDNAYSMLLKPGAGSYVNNGLTVNGPAIKTPLALGTSGTVAADNSLASIFTCSPSASTLSVTATNLTAGQRVTMIFTSAGTGCTITFSTGVKSIGTLALSGTAGKESIIEFMSDGTYLVELCRNVSL